MRSYLVRSCDSKWRRSGWWCVFIFNGLLGIMCLSNILPLGRFCFYKVVDTWHLDSWSSSIFHRSSFMGNLVRLHAVPGLEEHRRAGYQIYYNISKQNVLFPLKTSQIERKKSMAMCIWQIDSSLLSSCLLYERPHPLRSFFIAKRKKQHILHYTANLQLICQLVGLQLCTTQSTRVLVILQSMILHLYNNVRLIFNHSNVTLRNWQL